jgi:hypothetical protein
VLKAATPTETEVDTSRLHALGCSTQDLDDDALVIPALHPGVASAHPLTRERAIDEHGLPIEVRKATPLVRQSFNLNLDGLLG